LLGGGAMTIAGTLLAVLVFSRVTGLVGRSRRQADEHVLAPRVSA
jgi:hypothetical protein